MAKVIRSFSLDPEVSDILENYCRQSDNWHKNISRSKVVNDASRGFLSDTDRAELIQQRDQLMLAVQRANLAIRDSPSPPRLPWWRRLLLGR